MKGGQNRKAGSVRHRLCTYTNSRSNEESLFLRFRLFSFLFQRKGEKERKRADPTAVKDDMPPPHHETSDTVASFSFSIK